jgi:hypothetical protein
LSQLAAPLADRKSALPKTEKKMKTATRPMNEPISGLRTTLPIEDVAAGGAIVVFADGWSSVIDFMAFSSANGASRPGRAKARAGHGYGDP